MRKIMGKIVIVLAFTLASIPLALLGKGVWQVFKPSGNTAEVAAVSIAPTSPYEISYCSDETKNLEFVPEHIKIENANIDLPVVSVPLENGTWKVNAGVANFAQGTSIVNTNTGNVGIFAHNRKNAFAGIQNLTEGSAIEVTGQGYIATYRVEKTGTVQPDQIDVFYPTVEPNLTLVTCEGTFSEKRYIIQAKLVSIKCANKQV
jgi:LPXTG-site transpeptidase (sortase) family protein